MLPSRCCAVGVILLLLATPARCKVADDVLAAKTSTGTGPEPDGFLCRACGVFLDIVDEVLKNSKVEHWLIHFVQKHICPEVPTEKAREECVQKAPTVVPAIISWVEEIANAAMCSELSVCGAVVLNEVILEMEHHDDEYQHHHHHHDYPACKVCKNLAMLAKEAAQKVQPDTLVGRIEQLTQMCSKLGNEEAVEQCVHIVDKYGYLLVYFIEKEQHIDVEKACSDIGLCEKLSPEPVIDPLPAALVGRMASYGMRSSNDQDDCSKCKAIAGAAHSGVDDPDTMKDVIKYLSRPCRWIPVFGKRCREAVENFITKAAHAASGSITPENACNLLQYCNETAVSEPSSHTTEGKALEDVIYIQ